MPETMKILGNTEKNINTGKDAEKQPNKEISGVVLVHCNIVNDAYPKY